MRFFGWDAANNTFTGGHSGGSQPTHLVGITPPKHPAGRRRQMRLSALPREHYARVMQVSRLLAHGRWSDGGVQQSGASEREAGADSKLLSACKHVSSGVGSEWLERRPGLRFPLRS